MPKGIQGIYFTGLNNLKMVSILTDTYGEHFGFLQSEVDEMPAFYEREKANGTVRDWYDGYLFGKAEVYNPWSVINYVEALAVNPQTLPIPYWSNTSSNAIVKDLVERADFEDNLWNFLFFTGYLKNTALRMSGDLRYVSLAIPNREVRYVYSTTIMNWFRNDIGA